MQRKTKKTEEKTREELLSQFWTPVELALRICDWAELARGSRVLEPSAGAGAIVRAMPKNVHVTAIEIDEVQVPELRRIEHPSLTVWHQNFLEYTGDGQEPFDVAVMNPPYEAGADGLHVAHALRVARRVVCLVRANFCWGAGRYQQVVRWSEVTRRVVLVRRPKFWGPADKGHTAQHDMQVLELVRRETERTAATVDQVEEEYWT